MGKYEHNGVARTVEGWADHLGMSVVAMRRRLANWTVERAVTTPVRGYVQHGDLTGRRFGHLVVLGPGARRKSNHREWFVQCDCGAKHTAICFGLTSGSTKSCGCHRSRKSGVHRG